jgi:hypothetical protein
MPTFTKILNSRYGKLVFTLTRIYTVNGPLYFVSVFGNGKMQTFHMENVKGGWAVVRSEMPAEWIIEFEGQLAEIIQEQEQKHQ